MVIGNWSLEVRNWLLVYWLLVYWLLELLLAALPENIPDESGQAGAGYERSSHSCHVIAGKQSHSCMETASFYRKAEQSMKDCFVPTNDRFAQVSDKLLIEHFTLLTAFRKLHMRE